MADFDRDGHLDIAVSNHGHVRVYRNTGAGGFERLRDPSLDRPGDTHGVSWIDHDGDGWPDLLVSIGAARGRGLGANRLYRNHGGRLELEEALDPALADPQGRGRCALPLDAADGGGGELLLMNAYQPDRPQRVIQKTDGELLDIAPRLGLSDLDAECAVSFRPADGSPPMLVTAPVAPRRFRALEYDPATDRWIDASRRKGLDIPNAVATVAAGDIDSDDDIDLFAVAGGGVPDGFQLRENTLRFRLTCLPADTTKLIAFRARGDLDLDVLVEGHRRPEQIHLGPDQVPLPSSGWTGDPSDPLLEGPPVFRPDDLGVFLWRDAGTVVLAFRGKDSGPWEAAGSVRSETRLELIESVGLREVDPTPRVFLFRNDGGVFTDVAAEAGLTEVGTAVDAAFADLDNDGDLDLFVVTGGEVFQNPPDRLFANDGSGRFTEVDARRAGVAGTDRGRGNVVVPFDFDDDGDLDLFVANGHGPAPGNEGPYTLLRNDTDCGGAAWVEVDRPGLAASVEVGLLQVRHSDGSRTAIDPWVSPGRFSNSLTPIHVGLGSARAVEIRLPRRPGEGVIVSASPGDRLRPSATSAAAGSTDPRR